MFSEKEYSQQRKEMLQKQIISRQITSQAVLQSIAKVPRHRFVPEDLLSQAYRDHPLPIGLQQTISQPYIVAWMTELCRPEFSSEKILEIGTGCGYQTAVLAEIWSEVYTIEILSDLSQAAQERLKSLGYRNIRFQIGNGIEGWNGIEKSRERQLFDAIIVTAASPDVPQGLFKQLKPTGRIVIPIGDSCQYLCCIFRKADEWEIERHGRVRFVPIQMQK